jgi:protocadherin alpha
VSGNLDAPEGGFDAIMQAIVCRNQIGWREKARRLLVFSTDAGFHYAGDGKLGGIVKPNDGLCHLDTKGTYTHSSLQDYPSISQINLKVKQNAINVIWAVTEEQINVYKRLTKHVEGSFAGKLSDDSSNVVELIREQYDAISSSVEMKDTASSAIRVKYFSSCLGTGPAIETSKCDRLKVGTKVDFIAEIQVTRCPANRSEWKQKFDIYPVRPCSFFFFLSFFPFFFFSSFFFLMHGLHGSKATSDPFSIL